MLRNYLIIALRQIQRQPFYAAINVGGLALGMAVVTLIAFYVFDELNYDRFHAAADRIYRVTTEAVIDGKQLKMAMTSPALGPVAAAELPEAEAVLRMDLQSRYIVKRGAQLFTENDVLSAEADFFRVFSFRLLRGDRRTALKEPYSVVLTPALANKYFRDVPQDTLMGQSLLIDGHPYRVTGLVEPAPSASHFHFPMILSFSTLPKHTSKEWGALNTYTYLLLKPGSNAAGLGRKLGDLMKLHYKNYPDLIKAGIKWEMVTQPLRQIHLYSHLQEELEPGGDIRNLYVFSAIGLFILVLAGINFMNLATARSVGRAKEVGVRKVLGSARSHLIGQFITESVLVSGLAMLLALLLVELLRTPFAQLSGKPLTIHWLQHPWLILVALAFAGLLGVLAGSYPAFYLSAFRPAEVLKGKMTGGRLRGVRLRNTLVTGQFVVSIALIACTAVVYSQLRYMREKNLGFDKENVVVISHGNRLGSQREAFYQSLRSNPRIREVGAVGTHPLGSYDATNFSKKEASYVSGAIMADLSADDRYVPAMKIRVVQGRNFDRRVTADTAAVLINEAALKQFGYQEPLGQWVRANGRLFQVIGVYQDYHFESMHKEVFPVVLLYRKDDLSSTVIRLQPGSARDALRFIQKQWEQFVPDTPFEYSFLDEDFQALFKADRQLGQLFAVFTVLAILIACLGLFSLAAFTAEQRTKEIGIRKVLGASVKDIVNMLSKDFLKLVLLANVIAWPLAWWAMRQWLQEFAYRVELGWGTFALAGGAALVIAILTVSYQAVKAALANPVKSLRTE